MNLQEYAQRIANTTKDDWTIITCWGFGAGPSYLESSSIVTSAKNELRNIEIESHGMRASLKSDLSIWIAWGYSSNPKFQEPWANQFSDPQASSSFVDFFYDSVLVFRDEYVSVDGHRCKLPLPDRVFDSETKEVRGYTVSKDRYNFFKMLDGFEQLSEFDTYFKRAKIDIVSDPWMA